jgi:serine/threonine protein kinase
MGGEERIGTTLRGKYTIDRVLGEGGMATVFAATHRNKKRFAVKVLHPQLAVSQDLRNRFVREGYVANTVEHPGAVAVLDDDVSEDGTAFIVMELLEGAPLDAVWERATPPRLPLRAVLAIGVQLLDVLAAAHAKSVVHRDIKPQNLFVTKDGTIKVLDFGIARIREATSQAHTTQTGMMMGTPAFMPPEQALGKSREIDGQTDVWAAGATLFSLLSGTYVHEGESGQEVAVRAATVPPRSLSTVAPDVAAPVVAIVDRALAFDKASRWPNAAAMRDALEQAHITLFSTSTAKASVADLLRDVPSGVARTVSAGGTRVLPAASKPDVATAQPVGGTTSTPVSNASEAPEATPGMPRAVPRGVVIGGVVTACAAAGIMAYVAIHSSHTDVPMNGVVVGAVTASAATPVTSTTAAVSPSVVSIESLPKATATAAAVATTASARSTPSRTNALTKSPVASSATTVTTPAKAKNCDPPYTLDPSGKRIPKVECE